jgi:F-type H+-transporting ATPase subunit a
MRAGVLAASDDVTVGEHVEWHVLGLTLNADTVISTAISGVPSGLQLAFETVTEQVERQVENGIGIRTAPFVVPLAISLFFFILISNWLAILPHAWEEYVRPPTADVNLTFALSFFVIILVHITGARIKGGSYAKHVTLSLRLFGNMLAGTVMLSVIALLPTAVSWLPTAAWKLFDLFIGLLQALIFALLTILYFGFAVGSHEDEHG